MSFFFFSSRRRHTRCLSDWSSDVCSSDLWCAAPCQRMCGRDIAVGSPVAIAVAEYPGRTFVGKVLRTSGAFDAATRSEERRVGKEGRSRWAPYHLKKKMMT